MSMSHHNDPAVMKRFLDQVEGTSRREYPQGRMGADDDGALSYAIAADQRHNTIVIRFGKPVEWIGLSLQDAVELKNNLVEKIIALRTAVNV